MAIKLFSRSEKPKEIEIKDIPPTLLAEIKRANELEFYASFEAYKLVPPPLEAKKDLFKEWLPWISLFVNLIILIKVFLIK